MIDPRIKLRHLNCFLETARLGSLSAAASALSISQPAASKTLKELEDTLGKPLFHRRGRRLVLSTAGQLMQQHAGAAMLSLSRAQDLVRGSTPETRLAVGALPTAATQLLPEAALTFRAAYPSCKLRVSTGPNWLLMSQLREGQLDLVVGRMGSAEVMAGLSFQLLFQEQIVAVARVGHPMHGAQDKLAAFSTVPLILPPPGAVISSLVRGYLSRHGIPAVPAFETISLAFGRKVVQSSDAVWFISEGVVQHELDSGALSVLQLDPALPTGPVGISTRAEDPLSPEQEGLIAALSAAAT